MKIIGITGGVGAGKSAILNYIEKNYGAKVLKADEIAHELMEPGTSCYERLKKILPPEAILENGQLDRKVLAGLMFAREDLRTKINSIVHPAVKVYIINSIEKEKKAGVFDYFVIEAALLIEDHYDEICHELWYIYTSEENRKVRLMESRGYTEEKVLQIFKSQLTEEEYRNYCKVVIDNNQGLEYTFEQIKQVL